MRILNVALLLGLGAQHDPPLRVQGDGHIPAEPPSVGCGRDGIPIEVCAGRRPDLIHELQKTLSVQKFALRPHALIRV